MKATTLLLAAAALVGLTTTANAQISNSRHNFASFGWSGGEICKPCHTPHNSNETVGRLWNHALTTATYTMHRGTGTALLNIDSGSRLCLSCHDGTVALDSFGGATGTNFIGPGGNIGTNLNNDHPIGSDAVYPSTASTSYNPAVPSSSGTSATITNPNGTSLRVRAWVDGTGATKFVVGCGSCHSVHNTGGFTHMLRFSNANSAICLTCHIK